MSGDAHHDHAHAEHHDHSKFYIKVWAALFVLFLISVFGTLTPWFFVTIIVGFGIALVKAYLVVRYFMHVDIEKPVVHYALVAGLALMVLFFAAASPDVLNHEGSRWVNVAARAETERREAAHAAGEGGHHEAAPSAGHEAPAAEGGH
ncbi:MAG: cytochrome C oxidase subunit IV family protein [Deltaproteobacteria bacterium]|nr:cytochrome C oxidase subunit IV family protein [Deltaproteobacteria bacterium]